MSIVVAAQGATLRISFVYVDGAGAPVTGKVQGDFTITLAKDGTGNQSTTGITLTEVDASNNPGVYVVAVNGATGFVSALGDYALVINDTGTPTARWSADIHVTADTATTIGAAVFTSSTSDGRVTDGSLPLDGATVYLRNPSGTISIETTTDATGNWSAILNAAGTWTGYALIPGQYAQGTFTVTVAAGVATGPGTDIELSLAAASELTAGELWAYARRQARDRTGDKANAEIKDIVNDAMLMLATSAEWESLVSTYEIALNGYYQTGTVAATNGSTTLTLTGGTWPAWAADGEVSIDGVLYRVYARTSDTVLTLAKSYVGDTATGLTYTLYCASYALPEDLIRFGEPIIDNFLSDATRVGYTQIEKLKREYSRSNSWPEYWAMASGRLWTFPFQSEDRLAAFAYYRRPAELTTNAQAVDFDRTLLPLIYRAIDYQVCVRYGTTSAGLQIAATKQAFEDELARCINANRGTMVSRAPLSDGTVRTSRTVRRLLS